VTRMQTLWVLVLGLGLALPAWAVSSADPDMAMGYRGDIIQDREMSVPSGQCAQAAWLLDAIAGEKSRGGHSEVQYWQNKIAGQQRDLITLEGELRQYRAKADEYQQMQNQNFALQERLRYQEERLAGLKKAPERSREETVNILKIETENQALRNQVAAYEAKIKVLEGTTEASLAVPDNLRQLQEANQELNRKVSDQAERLIVMQRELVGYRLREEAERKNEKVKSDHAASFVPRSERPSDAKNEIQALRQSFEIQSAEIRSLRKQRAAYRHQDERLLEITKENQTLRVKLEERDARIAALEGGRRTDEQMLRCLEEENKKLSAKAVSQDQKLAALAEELNRNQGVMEEGVRVKEENLMLRQQLAVQEKRYAPLKNETMFQEKQLTAMREKIRQDKATLYQELGVAYMKLEFFDAAIDALEKSLQFNPGGVDLFYPLGLLYEYGRNDKQKALEYFQRFLKTHPMAKNRQEVEYLVQMLSSRETDWKSFT
jgi:tetratricopeptide (TPR) repeat protein